MMRDPKASLIWKDGLVPVSTRFDDPYFSLDNGLAETRHVFLDGNDLPDRLHEGFQVAELGFGTGLNMLALAEVWPGPGLVRFTSFEAYPLPADDIARALSAFPGLERHAPQFLVAWEQGMRRFTLGHMAVEVVIGDVHEALPRWSGRADAWFLDGFSPARNPEMWDPDLMQHVARHTAPGGTFATYTAAGHVRRGLAAAGFVVSRRPGFGRKRHMSIGYLPAAVVAP